MCHVLELIHQLKAANKLLPLLARASKSQHQDSSKPSSSEVVSLILNHYRFIIKTLKNSTGMPFHGLYVGNINKFPKRFIQEALNEESYDVRDQEVEPNGSANYVILWFHTKAYFNGARAAFIEWQPIGNHVRLKVYPSNKPPPAGLIAREVPKIDAKVKKIQKNLTDLVLAWDQRPQSAKQGLRRTGLEGGTEGQDRKGADCVGGRERPGSRRGVSGRCRTGRGTNEDRA